MCSFYSLVLSPSSGIRAKFSWVCGQSADCEAVCTKTVWLWVWDKKMPPWRGRGGRAVVITPKVRALQRQVEALQEQIHRGLNVAIGNESEEENEEQTNVAQEGEGEEEILNEVEERLFRTISNLGKRPKFDVGMFSGNLNPDELID